MLAPLGLFDFFLESNWEKCIFKGFIVLEREGRGEWEICLSHFCWPVLQQLFAKYPFFPPLCNFHLQKTLIFSKQPTLNTKLLVEQCDKKNQNCSKIARIVALKYFISTSTEINETDGSLWKKKRHYLTYILCVVDYGKCYLALFTKYTETSSSSIHNIPKFRFCRLIHT